MRYKKYIVIRAINMSRKNGSIQSLLIGLHNIYYDNLFRLIKIPLKRVKDAYFECLTMLNWVF